MKKKILIFSFLIMTMLGCSSNKYQTYALIQDAYITTVDHLVDNAREGRFTQEEWTNKILPLIQTADGLLSEYQKVLMLGVEADLDQYKESIRALLNKLRPYITNKLVRNIYNECSKVIS